MPKVEFPSVWRETSQRKSEKGQDPTWKTPSLSSLSHGKSGYCLPSSVTSTDVSLLQKFLLHFMILYPFCIIPRFVRRGGAGFPLRITRIL